MKNIKLLIGILFLFFNLFLQAESTNTNALGSRLQDSLALVELYQQMEGGYWNNNTNWLSDEPLENWFGIVTEFVQDGNMPMGAFRVTAVNLPNNNLRGILDTYIDNLFYLDLMYLNGNRIQGLGNIFQTAPWSPQVNYYLPSIVNINNNAIHYPDLEANACWLAIIGTYAEQHLDTLRIFRKVGNAFAHIPFESKGEESMIYLEDHNNVNFDWYYNNAFLPDEIGQTLTLAPYGNEDMDGLYERCVTFPLVPISHCGLAAVAICATYELIVYDCPAGDIGDFVSNQFIIKYDLDISAAELADNENYLRVTHGANLVKECPCGPNVQLWSIDESVDLETVRCGAESRAKVDTTELNFLYHNNIRRAVSPINNSIVDTSFLMIEPMNKGATSIIVGVNDSGIKSSNPHLTDMIWENEEQADDDNCVLKDLIGYDFLNARGNVMDVTDHGTAVNGVIARKSSKDILSLMNTKFYEGEYGELFDAVCGMHYMMDNGAKVLNLSWGYYSDSVSTILSDAIERAANEEVLIVTSAGNEGTDNDLIEKWPGNFTRDFNNMIVVAAYHDLTTGGMLYPDYSNTGLKTVHLAAPGHVRSTDIAGGLNEEFIGTSMSTPYVSRAAAVLMNEFPELSMKQVKEIILSTVRVIPEYENWLSTSGVLDFPKAHSQAQALVNSLAVDWLSFNGKLHPNQQIKLEWKVQNERGVKQYEVWRSNNGQDWKWLDNIPASSSSNSSQIYHYWDEKPTIGTNYYQIKELEERGRKSASQIINIKRLARDNKVKVYPNPVQNYQLNISQSVLEKGTRLEIITLQGQRIYHQNIVDEHVSVQLPKHLSGLFLLHVVSENQRYSQKIFVQN